MSRYRSNGHLSEYVPWYRTRPELIDRWIYTGTWIGGRTAGYLNHCRETRNEYADLFPKWMSGELEFAKFGDRSTEHFSYIVESLETGRPYRGHFNIENRGLISNLPDGCTIEIPCYVDGNGISPAYVGPLPMQCAAICNVTIGVQQMAVEAALTGNKDLLHMAVYMDPLTGAACTLDQASDMCDEMLEALAPWMPQYNGEGRTWADMPQTNNGVLRMPK